MPQFSLRTLILVMLASGPLLAGLWWLVRSDFIIAGIAVYYLAGTVWTVKDAYRIQSAAHVARRTAMQRVLARKP